MPNVYNGPGTYYPAGSTQSGPWGSGPGPEYIRMPDGSILMPGGGYTGPATMEGMPEGSSIFDAVRPRAQPWINGQFNPEGWHNAGSTGTNFWSDAWNGFAPALAVMAPAIGGYMTGLGGTGSAVGEAAVDTAAAGGTGAATSGAAAAVGTASSGGLLSQLGNLFSTGSAAGGTAGAAGSAGTGSIISGLSSLFSGGGGSSLIGGALSAIGSMAGANSQADAAREAARQSAGAANNATALQREIYEQTRADQTPWRQAGTNALQQLTGMTGQNGDLMRSFGASDFQADPGYRFRMDQGNQAIERANAARGGLYSGRAAKDLSRFSQGLASDEYQNAYNRFNATQSSRFNRLASLAGIGQTANNALQTAGTNYANNAGNLAMTSAANQGMAGMYGAAGRASAYGRIGNTLSNMNWGNMFNGSNGGGGAASNMNFGSPSSWWQADYQDI